MFIEDIKDRILRQKYNIITLLVIFLGLLLSYIIEGDPLGNFAGWWLLVVSIIMLIISLVTIIISQRKSNKKEVLSNSLLTIILIVLIYLLYKTII